MAALCMVLVFTFVYSDARSSTYAGIVLGVTEFPILGGLALTARESGYNPLLHTVVPVLAILVMIPALMAAVGIGSGILSFIAPLPSPFNIAAWITVGWLVLGVAYAAWICTAHPDRARATETIFIDEPATEAAGSGFTDARSTTTVWGQNRLAPELRGGGAGLG